jgi:hypothetical protein
MNLDCEIKEEGLDSKNENQYTTFSLFLSHRLTRRYPPPLYAFILTKTMSVIHVVLFQFKADAKPQDVKAVGTTADVDISTF